MKKIIPLLAALLLVITLSGCETGPGATTSSDRGQKLSEESFAAQEKAVPFPAADLKDSLERRNLKERLLRQNESDRVGYVYMLSFGEFIGYYTIKGKVSSTQSQMKPSDLTDYACDDGITGCQVEIKEGPGDDGSYGPNEDGVFFFTTNDVMVQTSTDYIYSDQPIAVGGIPELD